MKEKIKKDFTVYAHISPNGKVYVGITCQRPERRWKNGKGYDKCSKFYNAINKDGWDNFDHQLLFTNIPEGFAKEIEKALIRDVRNEFGRENVYNITNGGDGNAGTIRTEEQRKQISETLKRKGCSRGKNNPMYGVHRYGKDAPSYGKNHTEETKRKISEAQKGKYVGKNNPKAHKVQCIETGQIFDYMKQASQWCGLKSHTSISFCCTGKRNVAGGYHWQYYNEENN